MNRKRGGVQSRKQQLSAIITPLAVEAKSLTELAEHIKKKGLKPYYRRGMLTGIIDTNKRKYRLRRLGVTLERITELKREELRLQQLKNLQRNTNNKNRSL